MSTGSIVHSVGSTLVKKQNIRGTLSGSQTLIFNISWKIVCLKNNLWEEKENLDLKKEKEPVPGCYRGIFEFYITEENPIEPEPFLELEEETEGAPASSLYLAPNSCQGRCLEAFDKHHPCHCNAHCPEFGNCCEDFESLCGHEGCSHSSDAINKEELQSVSEKIYRADTNKARKEDIVLNSQNCILPSETRDQVDHCPEPLFTYVNKKLFSKPTYTAFINLLNNYQRATGRGEHFTAQELAEQDTFLREIMKTDVMKELYGFLHQQNRYSSEQEFVSDLRNMWFGLYSRSKEERD
ncbi:hypothetical protein MJT46_017162 [Ovis ammon polii x Ovis aries]|nr:hypothetical protein MJT46_017162 [Ovis ammon polii x Ovis aries]